MRHLLEYESYPEDINEGAIPVYDDEKLEKNLRTKPEMEIKYSRVPNLVESMLKKVESGEYKQVSVLADVPTQGKNVPQYIRDLMDKERIRLAKRSASMKSRDDETYTEPEPEEDEETGDGKRKEVEQREGINVFVDSEFIVREVAKDASGIQYLITTPASFIYKIEFRPDLKDYYTVNIYANQVQEVYFLKNTSK